MIGQTLGRYRVLEQIGAGGMGLVFRAHDERLDRDVALKILPPGTLTDDNARGRFRKEALTLSKLNHPNIETVFDFDTQDSVDFLVMELIPGVTLDEKLSAGALPEKEVLRLGTQLAEGLAAAHAEGVIHRDLKPGNLRLTPDGRLKILDFGLAKLLRPTAPDAATESLSKTHGAAGTLPYMAPEQLQGQPADARSDLWAAGAALYELATGRRPFPQASAPMLTDAILRQAVVPPRALSPSLSSELERIVAKLLDKDPEHRYQSALELRADLMRLKRDSDSGPQPPAPPPWGLRRRVALGIGLFALALLLGAGALFLRSRQAGESLDSIAVLPFVNVGADPNTEYLSDGISESLINSLSELPHLRVMSRNSVARYKGREVDAQAAGRELKVQAVLTGRVTQRGQNLSVSVELVDVANNSHLWGEDYDRNLTGALSIQQEITRNIADQLRRKLSGEDEKRLARRSTTDPEAYRLYLQGRYYVEKYTHEGIHKGSEYFEKAIDLDPSYALAYTGLAYANWVSDDFLLSPADSMPRAREAAARALELDDTLPEAHMQMGIIHLVYDFDWPGAERELRRAIELKPDYALAHEYYGWYLVTVGRFEEGIQESRRGVALEPLSAEVGALAAQNYYFALRYDLAIEQLHKTLERDPDFMFAHFGLGTAYEAKGDYVGAIREMQRTHELEKSLPWARSLLGHAYAVSGRKQEARQVLKELETWSKSRYVPAYNFAEVYVGLGEKEKALAALEKAYEDRSMTMTFITTDPRFDSLRSEPRFKDLMRRLNLPK